MFILLFFNLGVNSYPTFGAQGDLTDNKLTIVPVLQNTQTLYEEQLSTRLFNLFFPLLII